MDGEHELPEWRLKDRSSDSRKRFPYCSQVCTQYLAKNFILVCDKPREILSTILSKASQSVYAVYRLIDFFIEEETRLTFHLLRAADRQSFSFWAKPSKALVNALLLLQASTYTTLKLPNCVNSASEREMLEKEEPASCTDLLAQLGHLKESFRTSERRVFILDYDGTLAPIVSNPALATLPPYRHVLLNKLASDQRNKVWIVSGRDRDFMAKEFGPCPQLGVAAEHGAFFREPKCTLNDDLVSALPAQSIAFFETLPLASKPYCPFFTCTIADQDRSWMAEVEPTLSALSKILPYTWIEKKASGFVWHWRSNQVEGKILAPAVRRLLESRAKQWGWPVQVREGNCILEIRFDSFHKGTMVETLMAATMFPNSVCPTWLLCAGDDSTDEGEYIKTAERKC